MGSQKVLLSILIPTRNRAHFLKTSIGRIVRAINFAKSSGKVELVIANNFSTDETENLVLSLAKDCDFIHYYKHVESYPSAEESMMHAIKYCNGEYVWTFGDDDYMECDAVLKMIKILETRRYDLVIQNIKWMKCDSFGKRKYNYIQVEDETIEAIEYVNHSMFMNFGFWHITTAFAAICFNKEKFKNDIFAQAINISKIYSYPIALLISFQKSRSLFVAKPTVLMTENSAQDEFQRMSNLTVSQGFLKHYSWSTGFIRLLKFAEEKTKISLKDLATFREVIRCRINYNQTQCYVIDNITSHLLADLKALKSKDLLKYQNRIKLAIEDYMCLLETISVAYPYYNIIHCELKKVLRIFSMNRLLFVTYFLFKGRSMKKFLKKITLPSNQEINHLFYKNKKSSIELENNIELINGKALYKF